MEILLQVNKSLEENASDYFNKAKKAKKKLEGAQEALEETKKKIAALKKEKEAALKKLEQQEKLEEKKKAKKTEWYEKYRWFYSSEGFLCVGGRDATTNEIIIKKYTDKDDIVFHTDMAGSPFFVVKTEKKKASKKTLQECADATASFSRAWKLGMQTLDVFYVKPEQVTKEAQSGEYLTKGSFMIKGKTTYVQPNMEVAISLDDKDRIISGSKSAVEKNKKKDASIVLLKTGRRKPSDIAKEIKKKLNCDNDFDEIIRMIPAGNSEISKD